MHGLCGALQHQQQQGGNLSTRFQSGALEVSGVWYPYMLCFPPPLASQAAPFAAAAVICLKSAAGLPTAAIPTRSATSSTGLAQHLGLCGALRCLQQSCMVAEKTRLGPRVKTTPGKWTQLPGHDPDGFASHCQRSVCPVNTRTPVSK